MVCGQNTTPDTKLTKGETSMTISKRELIAQTAKQLGSGYTIDEVKEIYEAITNVATTHLLNATEYTPITVKFGNGLSVTSKIKVVYQIPRMWLKSRISRHFNRNLNEV